MLELGPLAAWIPDSGLTRINLPGGGLIEPVTASARSRLGQRTSFVVQDQTESWVRSNNGWWLADNQRRNLAGMGGRFLEPATRPTLNSLSPPDTTEPGVYIDDVDGGPGSSATRPSAARCSRRSTATRRSRRRLGRPDRIDAEIEALLEHDPAQRNGSS
jgi:hypothetical protein